MNIFEQNHDRANSTDFEKSLSDRGLGTWKVGGSHRLLQVGAQKAVYGKTGGSFSLAAGKTNLGHLEGRGIFGGSGCVFDMFDMVQPLVL